MEFAGTSFNDVSSQKALEKSEALVESASIKISRQIFKYWTQNKHLKAEFSIHHAREEDPSPLNKGYIAHTRILNELHGVTVDFDDRNAGFVWFFSFLVLFSQVKGQHESVIILLDEPGLVHGTKVGDDVLSTDKDTLFPLPGALGYEITQTLFVGPNTLIVEGPSDILYIQAFSEEARCRNLTTLNPK